MRFVAKHVINCDEETFWRLFWSRELNARMYTEVFKFPHFEILEQSEDERSLVRKATAEPHLHAMPDFVQKMLGSKFRYIEESVFDKTARTWRWKMTPSLMPERLCNKGELRIEQAGRDRVMRIAEVSIEAKVFGVGKILEAVVKKELCSAWDDSAAFLNRWLEEHPPETRILLDT
jgi:hypothetical protein